jgi:23S rRNA (adenine2503-C2)-methyltransferase
MPHDRLKPLIRSLDPTGLADLLASRGQPRYRGGQLARWLYVHGVTSWDEMSDLPESLRRELAGSYDLNGLAADERQVAADQTRKYLFRLRDRECVESVLIPRQGYATFCVSSQVGCAMACRFCASARGGLVRDLAAGEIVEQVLRLRHDLTASPPRSVTSPRYNIVFMGMGEPFDNWDQVRMALDIIVSRSGLGISPRRIQVSTAAPPAALDRLADCPHPVGLTISLGGATDEQRRRVMPAAGCAPIGAVLAAAERYARRIGRHVTVAYVLIAGLTDEIADAHRLARRLAHRPFKVNLIPLNRLDDDGLVPTAVARAEAFQQVLTDAQVRAFVRISGGQDIGAACGQLRRRAASRTNG